jgi:hypothetical protein
VFVIVSVRAPPNLGIDYLSHSRRVLRFQTPDVLMCALRRLAAVTPACDPAIPGPNRKPKHVQVNLKKPSAARKAAYQAVLDLLPLVCSLVLEGMRAEHPSWRPVTRLEVRAATPGLVSDHLSPEFVKYGPSKQGWEDEYHRDQPRPGDVNSLSFSSSRGAGEASLSCVITILSGKECLEIEDVDDVGKFISVHTNPCYGLVFPPYFQHRIPRTESDRLVFAFSMHSVCVPGHG